MPRMALRSLLLVLLIGLLAATVSSCRRGGGSRISVIGSTSVQPFAEKLAAMYESSHPATRIEVQGGGSSVGVNMVKQGAASIGMSSRDLKDDEKAGLKEFIIARDGIAIIVHKDNPIAGLTLSQVREIFEGRIKNWSEVGGADGQIYPVTREEGSGTRGAFQELVMKVGKEEARIASSCQVFNSNGAVRESVSRDRAFIGYISLGLVNVAVKALDIDKVAATDANIVNGTYPFARPFLFLTKGEPSPEAAKFIEWILSDNGQALLEKEGLIRAK